MSSFVDFTRRVWWNCSTLAKQTRIFKCRFVSVFRVRLVWTYLWKPSRGFSYFYWCLFGLWQMGIDNISFVWGSRSLEKEKISSPDEHLSRILGALYRRLFVVRNSRLQVPVKRQHYLATYRRLSGKLFLIWRCTMWFPWPFGGKLQTNKSRRALCKTEPRLTCKSFECCHKNLSPRALKEIYLRLTQKIHKKYLFAHARKTINLPTIKMYSSTFFVYLNFINNNFWNCVNFHF